MSVCIYMCVHACVYIYIYIFSVCVYLYIYAHTEITEKDAGAVQGSAVALGLAASRVLQELHQLSLHSRDLPFGFLGFDARMIFSMGLGVRLTGLALRLVSWSVGQRSCEGVLDGLQQGPPSR